MPRQSQIYSGYDKLPWGSAPDTVVDGCMALEGGAFRGVYGEGVLDALMEAGINLQCTVGVSAGAMNGYNYVSGQIGRSARVNLKYRHDSRYIGLPAMVRNKGVIGFDFVFGECCDDIPFDEERFNDPRRRFIAVATSLLDGEAVYFERGVCSDIDEAIKASASMPCVSKPVVVDGIPCLDGGCRVKIPHRWAIEQGYEKIVVIMTRQSSYRKKETSKTDYLSKAMYKDYPEFLEVQLESAARTNRDRAEIVSLAKEGRLFLIAPSVEMGVGRLEKDMEKLGSLYLMGYHDGEKAIPALKEYLEI